MEQIITYNNSNWAAVYLNLCKARRRLGVIVRVLEMTGAMVRAQGSMYKVVAQLVLLYGNDSLVVTREIFKVLTAFHHRSGRRITLMTEKRWAGGEWEYPSLEEAMESAGLHFIGVYIKRRQTNIS